MYLDFNLRGRNCDRAVERSTPLEAFDEIVRLRRVDAAHAEPQRDRREQAHVVAGALARVEHALDAGAHPAEREAVVAGEDLDQLDAARGDAREEQFGGPDGLAGAAVGYRTIGDQMLVSSADQHPSEDVG